MLYIVPTPVGNLEDITLRAIRILKEVDLVLAEDTRTSSKLLNHLGISTSLKSFHTYNEHKTVSTIIDQLKSGKTIALISDAGTPGISDPAFLLVRACLLENLPISCLPGPTALIPALVMSGLPLDRFYFEGFLPHKKGRQTRWKWLASLDCTFALYESPFRVLKCLQEIHEYCGDRSTTAVREISKIHEQVISGKTSELIAHFTTTNPRGEFVLIVGPSTKLTHEKG